MPWNRIQATPWCRYKSISGWQALFDRFPGASWYVMVDDDAYIFWGTLQRWLSGFHASEPHYLGRPFIIGNSSNPRAGRMITVAGTTLLTSHWYSDAALHTAHMALSPMAVFGRSNLHCRVTAPASAARRRAV